MRSYKLKFDEDATFTCRIIEEKHTLIYQKRLN